MHRKGFKSLFFKSSPAPSSLPPSSPTKKAFSHSLIKQNIETARTQITKWDPISDEQFPSCPYDRGNPLFSNTRQEAKQYLTAIDHLQDAMTHLAAHDSSSEILVQAHLLMQLAMKRLEKEFSRILSDSRDSLDPESVSARSSTDRRSSVSDYDDGFSEEEFKFVGDYISAVAVADLRAIADCMINAGYSRECMKVFVIVRKSVVEDSLYNLGVEKLTFTQLQKMDWEILELKIKCWTNAVKVAVRTLFPGERTLCEHVFGERKKIVEASFAEICREGAASLFGFPENVAKCKKTPEKMFRTMDLYEAICDNWPQIESVFSFDSTLSIRSQAIASQVRLAEAIRTMLMDFESAIQKESSKVPVPGGGIHPLTRYVMNYIAFLAEYGGVLADIVADWPQKPLPESYYRSPNREENPASEIAELLAWLILVVLCKLDGKAELYNDVALAYLFLANNMQYVVAKVRKSNLGFILGEDWLTKHEAKVKEYVSKYERVAWTKVFSALPDNITADMPAEQAKAVLLSFYVEFDEAYRAQTSWVVPDPKLRDLIKVSIASKLVPKYREFCEKCRVSLDSGIRYSPDDLGNYLSDILYGEKDSGSGSYSSHYPPSPHRLSRP